MNRTKVQNRDLNDDEHFFLKIVFKLWTFRFWILGLTLIFALLSFLLASIITPVYQSSVSMYKYEQSSVGGSLQSIASQFGVKGMSDNLQFSITDLVFTRYLKKKIVEHNWQTEKFEEPVDLVTYFEVEGDTYNEKLQVVMGMLAGMISLERIDETWLHIVHVNMPEPELAYQIALFVPEVMEEYINKKQKSNIKNKIKYINERLNTLHDELRRAENELKKFREHNRRYEHSVELNLVLNKLQREVDLKEQVFINLQLEKEKAKINLVKKKPVINVLDEPQIPVRKEKPRVLLTIVMGSFLGFCIGVLIAIGQNFFVDIKKYFHLYFAGKKDD